jgi:prophage regulatory protein
MKPRPRLSPDDRIIDPKELLERIPLDRSTIYRMVQEGRFPAPIQLTTCRIGWRLSSVLQWISEREANPVQARSFFGREKTLREK